MNQVVTEFRGRGIQQSDVFAAADALLAEGQRPTIERVRQKIGRGSPNTVSPMLERWFSTLSARMAGRALGASPTANEEDLVPAAVLSAAQLLWDTARREAQAQEESAQANAREDLRAREAALVEAQATLAQREEAFAQTRSSLDAALVSSQQAREALERQVEERTTRADETRIGLENEIKRLAHLLAQSIEKHESLQRMHVESLGAKDQDLRRSEERHAAQERRMLEEVDRARQSAKQAETVALREQQRRIQSEEAAAQALDAGRRMLRDSQDAAQNLERELRDRLTDQASLLAEVRSQTASLQTRAVDFQQQYSEERSAHEATRNLLARALAAPLREAEHQSNRPAGRRSK